MELSWLRKGKGHLLKLINLKSILLLKITAILGISKDHLLNLHVQQSYVGNRIFRYPTF